MSWALAGIALAAMLAAGIGKLLDVPVFLGSLESWRFIPQRARAAVGIGLPVVEVLVGGLALVCGFRKAGSRLAFLLLVTFTLSYAAHAALMEPPACACFGRVARFESEREAVAWTLGRNAVMLLLLLPYLGATLRRRARRGDSGEP